ncbi:MAG: SWIB/MDM2 domain-containing protein [Casimicrobiaceae bacterium]|nr:SWIB/MDM2 domain-containing protein [Casimicrobiaceae bacterium]MCX8099436.1 SWIB/MDM2 domain-containing protein [Casimicrobiaceae bacterium]MDW8313158.1 SWIB/MDM2 domain-containing protein [Burkholderiales bacterium]
MAAKKPAARKAAAKKAVARKAAAKKPSAKKPARKAATKKTAPKAAKKPATKRKPNAAFMKAMKPSDALAVIVGSDPLPRTEVTKRVWDYIKKNNLQDAGNKRMINADEKLRPIFNKAQVSMFEMTKLIASQLA